MPDLFESETYPHSEPFPNLPEHFSLVSAQKTGEAFSPERHAKMKHDYGLLGFGITEINDGHAFMLGHHGRPEDHESVEHVAWHHDQTEVVHSSSGQHKMVFHEYTEPDWNGSGLIHGPFLETNYSKLPSGHKFQLQIQNPFNKSDPFKDIEAKLQNEEVIAGHPWHYGEIEGINIFHALHQSHDELKGIHIYDLLPKQLPKLIKRVLKQGEPALVIHGTVPSELRGRGPQGIFPHCYEWPALKKNDGGMSVKQREDIYAPLVAKYGTIVNDRKTNLQFYDGIQNLSKEVKQLIGRKKIEVEDHPDAYVSTWRKLHELAHALTEKDVDLMYDEGRRDGRLGIITPREAKRALHWEYLAGQKQRELSKEIGFKINDEDFNRELNTLMHDATHRVITGIMVEPSNEGFEPSSLPLDWEYTLKFIEDTAHKMGLEHDEQTFDSAKVPKEISEAINKSDLLTGGSIRQFYLDRQVDESGVSGTGRVAEGVVFTNGWVAMTWLTRTGSLCFYPSISDVEQVHGHGGKTKVVFEEIGKSELFKGFLHADGETATDPKSHSGSMAALPPSLLAWGAEKLVPMEKDGIEVLELAGRIIKVRKVLEDLYNGWIEDQGQIRHQFERLTMPELLMQLQSKLEIYGKEDKTVGDEKTVEMPVKDLVEEHKELVDTLEHPTPAKLQTEAKEQGQELQEYKAKLAESGNDITNKLKALQAKIAEHVDTISGKELIPGIENPEQECPACERPVLQCICYTGLPKPRLVVTSKGVEIFFKSEWSEEDRINFLNDLKRRAGTILHQKLVKKAENALIDIRNRMKED